MLHEEVTRKIPRLPFTATTTEKLIMKLSLQPVVQVDPGGPSSALANTLGWGAVY